MVDRKTLDEAVAIFADDGLIGLPASDRAVILCDAGSPVAVERLRSLGSKEQETDPAVVLLPDLAVLRAHLPRLHPRIETLLAYHRRPLRLYCREWRALSGRLATPEGSIALQISFSALGQALLTAFGRPLAMLRLPYPYREEPGPLEQRLAAVDLWLAPETVPYLSGDYEEVVEISWNEKGKIQFQD